MIHYTSTFKENLFSCFQSIFRKETFQKFITLALGWILQSGIKRTSGLIKGAAGFAEKSFSSYYRFFNTTSWAPDALWKVVAGMVISLLDEDAEIMLAVDDTIWEKVGRKIAGVGWFPGKKGLYHKSVTYVWGQNWVVLAILLPAPFGIEKVFCFPIMARMYRKKAECKKRGWSLKLAWSYLPG